MFTDPAKNIEALNLSHGITACDFGSGAGHYVLALAKAVGEKGKVYAVDIQKELLTRVKNDASKQGFKNVEIVWGDLEEDNGSHLSDGAADFVVISNLLFQIKNKSAVAKEAARVLRSVGTLLLIDWTESFGGLGPEESSVVKKDDAIKLFKEADFAPTAEMDAGSHHWGIILRRN